MDRRVLPERAPGTDALTHAEHHGFRVSRHPGNHSGHRSGGRRPGCAGSVPETALAPGDILAVISKIVAKADGRQIAAADREQATTDETVRLVTRRAHPGGVTWIVENRLGIVLAAVGVDNSNAPAGTILLLPKDPDASVVAPSVPDCAGNGASTSASSSPTPSRRRDRRSC